MLFYQPRILSIMPTWQCTAACSDCGTESTPHVRTKLSTKQVIRAIETAADEGFSLVVFTGGEVTLAPHELREGLKRANKLGLTTRIVTNGWWAKSPELAAIQIGALVDDGLDEINFSTGDEHARFVPVERVVMGIRSAIDFNLSPVLMIELRKDALITKKNLQESGYFQTMLDGVANQLIIVESPWMPLEHSRVGTYPEGSMASTDNLGSKTGCESLFETHTVQANGRIGICCGLGMRTVSQLQFDHIDNLVSFNDVAHRAELDLVKILIKQIGPERLLARLAKSNPEIQWQDLYAHKCQACLRVFDDPTVLNAIKQNEQALMAEVATSIVLDHLLYAEAKSVSGNVVLSKL